MITSTRYGIHRQDNLIFLHEQEGGRCLNPQLERLESPFRVTVARGVRCPHQLGGPEKGRILHHPFVRAMGPDQEGGLYYVESANVGWIHRLSALVPTTEAYFYPFWGVKRTRLLSFAPKLTITNAAPLCLTDYAPNDVVDLETLAQLPRTRNLILCGPIRIPNSIRLDPAGLPKTHDWACEGRRQLYHLIRESTS